MNFLKLFIYDDENTNQRNIKKLKIKNNILMPGPGIQIEGQDQRLGQGPIMMAGDQEIKRPTNHIS